MVSLATVSLEVTDRIEAGALLATNENAARSC